MALVWICYVTWMVPSSQSNFRQLSQAVIKLNVAWQALVHQFIRLIAKAAPVIWRKIMRLLPVVIRSMMGMLFWLLIGTTRRTSMLWRTSVLMLKMVKKWNLTRLLALRSRQSRIMPITRMLLAMSMSQRKITQMLINKTTTANWRLLVFCGRARKQVMACLAKGLLILIG